jgi:acyl dehydratase
MAMAQYSMASAPRFVGRELGASDWVAVDQERIDAFAACTGDRQWIHVDVERARRESPFGGPIAHGYLTLSLVAAMVMELGVIPPDAATGLNYGLDKVRFLAPVKAGARVRARANLLAVEAQSRGRVLLKLNCTLEIEGEAKPALVAATCPALRNEKRPWQAKPQLPPTMISASRRRSTRWRRIRWSACAGRTFSIRHVCCSGRF